MFNAYILATETIRLIK